MMVVLGHKDIPHENLSLIYSIDQIKTTQNSTIFFEYDIDIAKHLYQNSIYYGSTANTIEEVIILSNLNAKYVVIENKEFAKEVQQIADNYLFDTKILVKVKEPQELEWTAINKIDGVILWEKLFSHNQASPD